MASKVKEFVNEQTQVLAEQAARLRRARGKAVRGAAAKSVAADAVADCLEVGIAILQLPEQRRGQFRPASRMTDLAAAQAFFPATDVVEERGGNENVQAGLQLTAEG